MLSLDNYYIINIIFVIFTNITIIFDITIMDAVIILIIIFKY